MSSSNPSPSPLIPSDQGGMKTNYPASLFAAEVEMNTLFNVPFPAWIQLKREGPGRYVPTKEGLRTSREYDAGGIFAFIPSEHYAPLAGEDGTRAVPEKTGYPGGGIEKALRYKRMAWCCSDTLFALHSARQPPAERTLGYGGTERGVKGPQLISDPIGIKTLWDQEMRRAMAECVFGSNYIERVGASLDITTGLCQPIWDGETLQPEDIDESTDEYQQHLTDIRTKGPAPNPGAGREDVVLSRREIINHARAMRHILQHFCIANRHLTEETIKSTHKILVEGIDTPPPENRWVPQHAQRSQTGHSRTECAGIYRTGGVRAGIHVFPHSDLVPALMKRLCIRYLTDVSNGTKKGSIDPCFLAAKFSQDIVQIHSFADGNGRMSRLILNAVLAKYLGTMAPICGAMSNAGESEELRREAREREYEVYTQICVRAGERRKALEEEDGRLRESRIEGVVVDEATVREEEVGEDGNGRQGEWFWRVERGHAGELAGMVVRKCWESMRVMKGMMEERGIIALKGKKTDRG